ncbi:MAG: hypothetical protein KUG82_15195 [Pseudomonadales bacterium]|nr:hypothetical protein [Pseudomonadales bacterium]
MDIVNLIEEADTMGMSKTNKYYSQALSSMAGLKSGISLACEIRESNLDTHSNHDEKHADKLRSLTNMVDLLWYLAD